MLGALLKFTCFKAIIVLEVKCFELNLFLGLRQNFRKIYKKLGF
jgi:hypothetical protein